VAAVANVVVVGVSACCAFRGRVDNVGVGVWCVRVAVCLGAGWSLWFSDSVWRVCICRGLALTLHRRNVLVIDQIGCVIDQTQIRSRCPFQQVPEERQLRVRGGAGLLACDADTGPAVRQRRGTVVQRRGGGTSGPGRGGVDTKHSTDVDSPPPPPRICMCILPEGMSCPILGSSACSQ